MRVVRGEAGELTWVAAPIGIFHATLLASPLRFCRALRRLHRSRRRPSPPQESKLGRLRRHVQRRDKDDGWPRKLPGVLRGNAHHPEFPSRCSQRSCGDSKRRHRERRHDFASLPQKRSDRQCWRPDERLWRQRFLVLADSILRRSLARRTGALAVYSTDAANRRLPTPTTAGSGEASQMPQNAAFSTFVG
jgi:hypothetical protein